MGSKGSQQKTESTSTATSAPNAQAGALYSDVLGQLQNYVAQNPNAPTYQGQQVAQFTPDQLAAMGTVNQAQGAYQPYMQQAGQFAQQAGSAITPGQINAAMNPYQQQVIDATMAQMGQKNAQQMSSLKGTEAQQGAFGGSRAAVTEATLGGQQNMNMASTLAGLNNQNYTQAVAQAQANRSAAGTGAQLESGLGTQSMQLPFMGAQQQAQQGALQQQLAQQNLNVPYQNFLQQQAWTPQMLQFEAGLGTGVGSQMGGTSTNAGTTTTTPAQPNPWMQAAGLGLSAAAMFSDKRAKENIEPVGHLNDGQKIYKYNYKGDPHTQIGLIAQEVERKHPEAVGESNGLKTVNYDLATRNAVHKADGGSVGSDIVGNAVRMARQMREGMAGGGVPGAGVGTSEYMGHSIPAIIPSMQITGGKGAPSTPGFVSSPQMKDPNAGLMQGLGSGLGTLAKAGYDKWNEPTTPTGYTGNTTDPFAGQPDATTSYMGGIPYPMFGKSLGGTVSPESAYHGFAHRAYGGRDVVFDPTPISEQGGEDPNKAPVMPAEGFTDQPPSIVPAGEFKPYEAPPQADVPMPRPRPENLRVDDLAAAPMPIGADAEAPVPMPRPRPENLRVDDLAAAPMPIGAAAEAPVPMPRPRPAQTAAQPTDDIFPRVLQTESTGRQLDENGNPLTSPKGAIGIAQIMPTTGPEAAKLAGLPWDEQKFKYDANYNAALGKAYFDHQTNVFGGDPEKGAAAYNAGPGRLREAMAMAAAHGGSYKDYLPAETQRYLGKVFGQKQADVELPTKARPTAYTGGVNEPITPDVSDQSAPGVGPRGDEGGQALAFNRESSIAGSQGIGTIDALRAQKDGGANAPLLFTQGEGGDRTNPAIDVAAQAIVPKNDDPRKLPQNLSILERVLGKEFDPATRQAIMAAGLRMMTTPGNIGTVLGTAGMQGMATYSEAKQLEQEQAIKQAQVRKQSEQERHQLEMEKAQARRLDLLETFQKGKLETAKFRVVNGALVNTDTGEVKYKPLSGLDQETLKSMAEQYLSGDNSVKQNIGRGAQGKTDIDALNNMIYAIGKEKGMTPAQISYAQAEFAGTKAAARALGTQEAKMGTAGIEARGAIELAKGQIEKLPRTSYLPINKLIEGYSNNTLNPEQAILHTRVQGIVNTYAAVMARGASVTTDTSRGRAESLLSTASNPESFNAVLKTLESEINMALNAPDKMREFFKHRYGDKSVDLGTEAQTAGNAAAAAAGSNTAKPAAPTAAGSGAAKPATTPAAPAAASKPAAAAPSQPPDAVGIRTAKDGKKYYVRQDLSVIGPVE